MDEIFRPEVDIEFIEVGQVDNNIFYQKLLYRLLRGFVAKEIPI